MNKKLLIGKPFQCPKQSEIIQLEPKPKSNAAKKKNQKNPQSQEADAGVKQEYFKDKIIDKSVAKSSDADEQNQLNKSQGEEEITENSVADSREQSYNSDCEDQIDCEEKKAVIREHLLFRREEEKNAQQEKRFKCNFCSRQYSYQKTLNEHISDVHSLLIEDGYLCLYCAKSYKTAEGRDNHEKYLCVNRPNANKKRKSTYQSYVDAQYDQILKIRAKALKKN